MPVPDPTSPISDFRPETLEGLPTEDLARLLSEVEARMRARDREQWADRARKARIAWALRGRADGAEDSP